MTIPRPDAPARWLSLERNRRLVGRALCALLLTGLFMLLIPWSVRLTQSEDGGGRSDSSASPAATAARKEKLDTAIAYGEIGVVFMCVAGFAVYEGGGFVLSLVVGMLDDAFAGRRTQPRAAVRDDTDL
jgi:hypothetical protein